MEEEGAFWSLIIGIIAISLVLYMAYLNNLL